MTFIRVKMMGQTVHARAVQQDSTRKYSRLMHCEAKTAADVK